MAYSFRVHFELDTPGRLRVDGTELLLSSGDGPTVRLQAPADQSLTEAMDIALGGSGYATEDQARADGERWRSALVVGLAQNHISAALRLREVPGGFNEAAFDAFRQALPPDSPVQLYNKAPGVQTFPTDASTVFVSTSARGMSPTDPARLLGSIERAHAAGAIATPEQLLAFDTYNASFASDLADVRLVCLVMAIEILIKQERRSEAEQAVIRKAIERAEQLDIDPAERQSFVSSLGHLLDESIGRAGLRLARSLGEATYLGESPEKFFKKCYDMRSVLVHGGSNRPSLQEVGERASALRLFVGDLLSLLMLNQ